MSKLLSANFMRLTKNKCFWGCFLFLVITSIYIPVRDYIDAKILGSTGILDAKFFYCSFFVPILLSVFCSLFVGTEYSDGTIRNKLMIGHRRIHIYFANLLTSMFAGLVMCTIYFIVYLCAGLPLLDFFISDTKTILCFISITIMLCFAFSSIFTMMAMISANKAVVSATCIISTFLLLLAGTYLASRLHEPETFSNYSYTVGGELQKEEEKNPLYLDGTKRGIYQFLYDFLPGGQVIQCSSREEKNAHILPVYSGIIFLAATSAGIVLFKRKDIK